MQWILQWIFILQEHCYKVVDLHNNDVLKIDFFFFAFLKVSHTDNNIEQPLFTRVCKND